MTILYLDDYRRFRGNGPEKCSRCPRQLTANEPAEGNLCDNCRLETELFERDRRWTMRD